MKNNYSFNYSYYDKNGTLVKDDTNDPWTVQELKNIMELSYINMARKGTDADSLYTKLNNGGGGFSEVTTTENGGIEIDGKYSFPGTDPELIGQNYQFPTIITQEDPFDSTKTVNVHYGQWPKGTGVYSDASSVTLDLLSSTAGALDSSITAVVKYYNLSKVKEIPAVPTITYTTTGGDSSDVVKCMLTEATTEKDASGNEVTVPKYYKLTINGWKEGYETINISLKATDDDGVEQTYTTKINLAVTAEMTIKVWSSDSTKSNPNIGESLNYKANVYDRNNTSSGGTGISGLKAGNWAAVTDDANTAEVTTSGMKLDTDGSIIIPVVGNKAGQTNLNVTVSGIKPTNYGQVSGVTEDRQLLTQTYTKAISVIDPDAITVAAMLYSNGERLDSETNKPVTTDAGTSVSSNAVSAANLDYWTSTVANDSEETAGKTFTGWITEDGTQVDASTVLGSSTKLNASWRCTEIVFMDGSTRLGSLSYYAGNFYTDSSLSVEAESAPQPLVHGDDVSFQGFATAETDGIKVSNASGSLLKNALSNAVDENTSVINVYAIFTPATGTAEPAGE